MIKEDELTCLNNAQKLEQYFKILTVVKCQKCGMLETDVIGIRSCNKCHEDMVVIGARLVAKRMTIS